MVWPLRIPQEQLDQRFNCFAILGQVFTSRECDQIRDQILKEEQQQPAGYDNGQGEFLTDGVVRQGNLTWLNPEDNRWSWIYQRCTAAIQQVNRHDWGFDLDYIDPLQFTCYDNLGDHYGWHIDNLGGNNTYRKLSFSIQLSTPHAYEGGNLEFLTGPKETVMPREQGTFIAFPSVITHRVTPITRGRRYSLVGWCTGPKFR